MAPHPVPAVNHFADADHLFADMKDTLQGQEMGKSPLSAVEQFVKSGLQKVGQKLMQAHVDLRSALEPKLRIVQDSDGVARTSERRRIREVTTIFGEVEVVRRAYEADKLASLFILDAQLNLPSTSSYSLEVESLIAREAASGSFQDATEAFQLATGVKVPRRQAEEITVRAARDFDAFYDRPFVATALLQNFTPLLVLTVDGKGIVMRKQDLREATKKKAALSIKKLTKRLSRGEKRFAKRMATVAAVYDIAPYVRKPEDVIRAPTNEPVDLATQKRPKPTSKRVWASIEKSAADVIKAMFDEANKRDPKHEREWVCLIDGADVQRELVEAEAARRGIKVTIVLDMIHVLEYLWKAARAMFDETSKEGEDWVTNKMLAILRGNAFHEASGMRRSATWLGLSDAARLPVDKCANYIQNNAERMQYDTYLSRGYPIATGVIEGACRYLVKDRMDITGARWSLVGAEAILKLRALRTSNDFDTYWHFHEEQELLRNHQVKFTGGNIPSARLRIVGAKR